MSPKQVRCYLHNLDGLQREISDTGADLAQYRAMAADTFRLDDATVKRDDFISCLENKLFRLRTVRAAINAVIQYLPKRDRIIVKMRYGRGWTWPKVAGKLNYNETYLQNIDIKTVKKIVANYNERIKKSPG